MKFSQFPFHLWRWIRGNFYLYKFIFINRKLFEIFFFFHSDSKYISDNTILTTIISTRGNLFLSRTLQRTIMESPDYVFNLSVTIVTKQWLVSLCRATKITLAICCHNVLARIYKKNSIYHRPNALRNSRRKNNPRERALLPLRETQPCAS